MKVLVTGGAGFIGSHVVDTLLAAGHQVAIVDNLWDQGGGRREHINPAATFYEMDIRDQGLDAVFAKERPEAICHLAAQHSVKISTDDPRYDAEVNLLGLINILTYAVKHGAKKVVFSSSGATYGTVDEMPIDETTPQRPQSPYGITKMTSEHYLRFWQDMYGLDFTALRYGNVYGPRQDPTGEAGVIAIFARRIIQGESVRIDWDGEQQKDYVFVGDVARANLLALTAGSGESYCIATGAGTSVNALYDGLCDLTGNCVDVLHAPRRAGDIYLSYFTCDKAARDLGWKAEVSLKEGMAQTVAFFEKQIKAESR